MKRQEFIDKLSKQFGVDEASSISKGYTDEDIEGAGEEIISDITEEYRFQANVKHYRSHGY